MTNIFDHLFTIDEWVATHKWPSKSSLRWMIYEPNAKASGFDKCIIRVQRRVFIDEIAFNKWMEKHRGDYSALEAQRKKKNGRNKVKKMATKNKAESR